MEIRTRFDFYLSNQLNFLRNSNERLTNKMEKKIKKNILLSPSFSIITVKRVLLKFGRM